MLMKSVIASLFTIFMFTSVELKDLPAFLPVCQRDDPQLEECIINTIHTLKHRFVVGIPELDIPSLEPIYLDDLIISNKQNGHGLEVKTVDTKCFGVMNVIVKKVIVEEYARNYTFDLLFPFVHLDLTVLAEGHVSILPVNGTGRYSGNYTDGHVELKVILDQYTLNGENFMNITDMKFKLKIGNGRLHVHNLFGSDLVLSDLINQAFNDDFQIFSAETTIITELLVPRVFLKTGNKILKHFTAEQLFP